MLDLFNVPPEVPGIGVRLFVVLAFTSAAAYYDVFNRKWVPNWLLYAFVGAAMLCNIIFFEPSVFWQSLLFGAVAFAFSYPLYKMGQLGGADVYAYASIAAAVPYLPSPLLASPQNVPYPFILSVLVPTGLAFILHMLARFVPYISSKIAKGEIALSASRMFIPALIAASFALFTYALGALPVQLPFGYIAALSFLFIALVFFSFFKAEIKGSMVEEIPTSSVQEEDVLAIEKMDAALVKKLKLSALIDSRALSSLRKAKIRRVPVYTKMPFFLPYLLFGLIFTILFGDLIYAILGTSGFSI